MVDLVFRCIWLYWGQIKFWVNCVGPHTTNCCVWVSRYFLQPQVHYKLVLHIKIFYTHTWEMYKIRVRNFKIFEGQVFVMRNIGLLPASQQDRVSANLKTPSLWWFGLFITAALDGHQYIVCLQWDLWGKLRERKFECQTVKRVQINHTNALYIWFIFYFSLSMGIHRAYCKR